MFPYEGKEEAAVTETRTCRRQSCHVIVTCRMNRMFSLFGKTPPFPSAFCTARTSVERENLAWICEDPAARPIFYAIHISEDTRGI